MNDISIEGLGLKYNPFDQIIAEKESSSKYQLYGRKDQLEMIDRFVKEALRSKTQKRVLIRGEYGTGKTHHLLQLNQNINTGKYGDKAIAIYLGNLGISFRRFYEMFVESLIKQIPDLKEFLTALPPVEPEASVDPAYKKEGLRSNIIKNIKEISANLEYKGYNGLFLLIDEAEDIVQSNDNDEIQYFIQSLVHLINDLQGHPLHLIMGFSREALYKISSVKEGESRERKLGDAFFQRFSAKEEIVLGYLSLEDTKAMVLDRLNSARITRNTDFYPIHEGVIAVTNEITGGHPRETLTIINKGIENALKSGIKEIDGTCILPVLATHILFFNKNVVLDWNRLAEITTQIRDVDQDLAVDFERLRGRLIGENGSVNPEEFTDRSFPEKLTSPIEGIRILERKVNSYGETIYSIHPAFKAEIFKGKRYNSRVEQLLDREIIDLLQNPEQYQKQLTSGFWKVIQEVWKGEFKNTDSIDNYQIIVGRIRLEGSSSPVSVAFTAYKGVEFPKPLYHRLLELLDSKVAHFGCVLYDAPRFEIDPVFKSFMNEVREQDQVRLYNNICSILVADLPKENNQLMGMIKLLGNRERNESDGKVDIEGLFQDIKVEERISQLVNERALTYPEDDILRRIVRILAAKPLESTSISELKDTLNSTFINKSMLERLESQGFIVKDGKGWRIASINNDPPWKAIYSFINEKGKVSAEDIRAYLEDKYVLQCPKADENHMVNWYLDILISQNMISGETSQNKTLYQLMDHSGKLESLLKACDEKLEELQDKILIAEQIQILTSEYKRKNDGFIAKKARLQNKFDIGSREVSEGEELFQKIEAATSELDKAISSKKKEYSSIVAKQRTIKDLFMGDIESGFNEGYISEEEHKNWLDKVKSSFEKMELSLSQNSYPAVAIISQDLENFISQHKKQLEERKTSKDPCIAYATKFDASMKDIEKILSEIEGWGYNTSEDRESVKALTTEYEQNYRPYFNSGKYDKAKECISSIYRNAQTTLTQLNQLRNSYSGYKTRIERLEPLLQSDARSTSLVQEAVEALKTWDFATVEIRLKNLDELRKQLDGKQKKTPEEIFLEKYAKSGTVTLQEVLKKYTVDEAFEIIKQLVTEGKIETIQLRFR